jgi:hypothetical protein
MERAAPAAARGTSLRLAAYCAAIERISAALKAGTIAPEPVVPAAR